MTTRPEPPADTRHPHSGGRTRRRGAALQAALLDAAWDELQASGYQAMTMEAVADRAGTSRAVLYRRWPKQAELVVATLRRHRPVLSGGTMDTGSLRGDVLALLTRASDRLTAIGPEIVYGLLGDYLADAELFEHLRADILQTGTEATTAILKRAAERGEARSGVPARIAAVPTDLFRNELMLRRTAPTPATIAEIVDEVFLPLVRP
ncbi:MAG TPA: TetR/AcrR family transcriptional regulator [Streptosporangiaceae bacterium]|nr:TetR/AcrR family transcriptional regulator [Streptosporangiaceae bacterium]